jgi:hypothetical protein
MLIVALCRSCAFAYTSAVLLLLAAAAAISAAGHDLDIYDARHFITQYLRTHRSETQQSRL